MTNENKPREFWVKDFKQARTTTMAYLYDAFDKPPQLNNPTPHIHVIEYSAYQALQVELATAKKQNEILREALSRQMAKRELGFL